MFFTANWMQTIKTDDVVKQNAVYDLTELLPKYDIYSPADVDKAIQDYQKALDDAGYQKVLAEAQKQYEDWKKVR